MSGTHVATSNNETHGAHAPSLLGYGFFYLLLCGIGIWLSQQPGLVATLWFADALGAAYLSRAPMAHWGRILAVSAAMLLLALWLGKAFSAQALLVVPAHGVEMVLSAAVIRVLRDFGEFETSPSLMGWVLLCTAVLSPAFGAALAGLTMQIIGLSTLETVWMGWFGGSMVGTVAILPLAIALARTGWRGRRRITRKTPGFRKVGDRVQHQLRHGRLGRHGVPPVLGLQSLKDIPHRA